MVGDVAWIRPDKDPLLSRQNPFVSKSVSACLVKYSRPSYDMIKCNVSHGKIHVL
jgi:hypothetical protein